MPRPIPPSSILDECLDHPALPVHRAARHGNTRRIQELIADDYSPRGPNAISFGAPLHIAIVCDQLPSVLTLLLCGADTEAFSPNHFSINTGHTADNSLRMAVRWGRREIAKVLWDLGVSRDALNEEDAEAEWLPGLLEIAAWEGHVELVRDLLSWSEAWTDQEKENALVNGARIWEPDIVSMFLAAETFSQQTLESALGAAVDNGPRQNHQVRLSNYTTSEYMASKSGQEAQTIELLLDAGLVVDLGALLCRVSFRPWEIEAMKLLLERGADVSTRVQNGWTPLHFAARRKLGSFRLSAANEKGLKLLLEYGADVYAIDEEGHTPLHILVDESPNIPLLKHCLEHGNKRADGRLPRNQHGISVLHYVCSSLQPRGPEILETLLDSGFDVNQRTETGWTPLMCAISVGPRVHRIIDTLLSRGADVTAVADGGWTALHGLSDTYRTQENSTSLAEDLIARGADVSALATVPGNLARRKPGWGYRYRSEEDVQCRGSTDSVVKHRTPLHGAAESGATRVVRTLLKYGADPLAMDSSGCVPVNLAAWSAGLTYGSHHRIEVLRVLLKAAPIGYDIVDEQGLSVRDWVKLEDLSENWRLWW